MVLVVPIPVLVLVVLVALDCPPREGSFTGCRKTITQATATKHAAAAPRILRLRRSDPTSKAMKKPLRRKKSRMLRELFKILSASYRCRDPGGKRTKPRVTTVLLRERP